MESFSIPLLLVPEFPWGGCWQVIGEAEGSKSECHRQGTWRSLCLDYHLRTEITADTVPGPASPWLGSLLSTLSSNLSYKWQTSHLLGPVVKTVICHRVDTQNTTGPEADPGAGAASILRVSKAKNPTRTQINQNKGNMRNSGLSPLC